MKDTFSRVRQAAKIGLDTMVKSLPPRKTQTDKDLEFYMKMKSMNFQPIVKRYGRQKTLEYVRAMEDMMRKRG